MTWPIQLPSRLRYWGKGFIARAALAAFLSALILLCGAASRAAAKEADPAPKAFDVPAGDATVTLKSFADQSGEQVVYLVDDVRGFTTNAVAGSMTAREALTQMVAGTRLEVVEDAGSGAIRVQPRAVRPPARKSVSRADPSDPEAAEREDVVQMNPFLVSQVARHGYTATESMSGSKTVQSLIDLPQTVTVVTRDLIDDTGLTDPNAIMEQLVPGVSNLTGPGDQGINAIIRGFRSQNWAVDGAESRYLSEMASDDFEDIEVIKGPAATLYGPAGAFGGYINVAMKIAQRMPVNKFLLQVGSDNLYHGMLDYDVAVGPKDDVQYRVVLGYQNSRYPDRNYDYNKVQSIMPSLAIDLNSRSRLTSRFEYIHSNQAWSPSVMGLDNKPLPFSPLEAGDRYLDIERTFQSTLTTQINDNWSFKANFLIQTMADDWLYGSMSSAVAQTPQALYTFTPNKRVYTQKTWYGDATLDWKHDDLGHGFSNDVYFDGNIEYFDENIKWLSNSMLGATPSRANPLINPLAPDLNAMSAQFAYSSTETVPYSTELEPGLSVSETFGMFNKRLQFVGRSRFNYDARTSEILINSPANNPVFVNTGAPAVLNTNEKLTSDYGAIFKIIDGWSLYYGHSESYLPVGTGTTYLYQPLATETGKNDEVGSKLDMQIWGGTLTGSTALFSSDVDNLWIPDPVHPGFFVGQGDQKNRGIEAQLGYTNKKFSAVAGFYNATGPYQVNQPATGIQPAGDLRAVWAPKVTYDFWGKYNFFGNFSAGGGYRYQGNALSSSRLLVSPGFDNIDLFANYVIPMNNRRITFQATVTNLENKRGIMREDNVANVYVEEGRRVSLTVSYTW